MPSTFDAYGPFDSGPGANATESLWRKVARNNRPDGVLATQVLPDEADEMEVYAAGTAMEVKVRAGEVIIHGHWGRVAATKTLPITPSDPSNPRIDLVVCRADFAADKIELDVLGGTPAVSPTAPTVTENSTKVEIPLAQVQVDAGVTVIAASEILDLRPRQGFGMYKAWEPPLYYEGAAGSYGEHAVGMGTGATRECAYYQSGKVVQIRYKFTWGTAPYNAGTGRIWTTLPPGMIAADDFGQFGTDHRVPTELWVPGGSGGDFNGTSLISPGRNRVWPFFTYNAIDARVGWYVIARHGSDPYVQWPFIASGFPEGGSLVINGLLEIR